MGGVQPHYDGFGKPLWFEGEFGGLRWSFEREDADPVYIASAIEAWKAFAAYVKKHPEEFADA